MNKLNKNSSVPLYQQLVDEIKSQIDSGILKENDRIMTETELSDAYEVSRITVRKAISVLVDEDYLVKQQGIGTFVGVKRLSRSINSFMGFTQFCEATGMKASSILLTADSIEATISECGKLGITEGSRVIRIRRVRCCNGIPVIVEENKFPSKYSFLIAEDLTGSIYEILKNHGIFPVGGSKIIDVCYATEEEQKLLNLETSQALLLQKDTAHDANDEQIHICKQVINPARYKIEIRW